MRLDTRTLLTLTGLVMMLSSLRGAALLSMRRTYAGYSRWTIAGLLILGAACLFLLRPLVPDWTDAVGANSLIVVASILYLEGAREFRGLPPRQWAVYVFGLPVITSLVYYTYFVPSYSARASLVSLFMGIILILCALKMLKVDASQLTFGVKLTGGAFVLSGVLAVISALYVQLVRLPGSLFDLSSLNDIFLAGYLVSQAGFSLGIVLLADERTKSHLAEVTETAARAGAELARSREAEAALRESERRFRNMADCAPVLVWMAGKDKLCNFFNRPWLDFTGRTLEEEMGDGWTSGVHPDDLEHCIAVYSSSFDVRVSFEMEYRLRRADGTYRHILNRGAPLHFKDKFAGYVGSCVDVTEQKLDEKRQQAIQIRLTEAQRLAKIGSWQRSSTTEAVYWSEEMFRIFGLTTIPPNLSAVLEHIHPADREKVIEGSEKARSGKNGADFECRIIRPDGEVRFVRSIIEAVRDDRGAVANVIGATQDITEQVEARVLLQESEARLRTAERLAHVGNWQWDVNADRLIWSEEMYRIFGKGHDYTPTTEDFFQTLIPPDKERMERQVRHGLPGESGSETEYQIMRPDGELRTVNCVSQIVRDREGLPTHVFGACQDITDFKRAQNEAISRQKLETVGTLAGGIAHDFNNLLGGVLAQSEVGLQELAAGATPEEELRAIREVAIRGSEIVRQLMIYAGKESEVTGPIDVSQSIGGILHLLKVVVSKHATLETDLGTNLPPVRANAAQLAQIAMNLVTNASEALADRDGVIRLSTRAVTVGSDSSGSAERLSAGKYLKLEVSDTGGGMRQETQARAFDPFFTTKAVGGGLGLAVIQGIVRGLGGVIRLASELGKGTTFQILLPCVEATGDTPGESRGHPEAPAPPAPAATILFVEDEDLLRQAVSKMLRNKGYSVIEAGDGSAALEQIRALQTPIDVVFLDITLPGAPSSEVFYEAKRLRPETQLIITSAYTKEMASAALQANCEHFLRKPYSLGDLNDLMRRSIAESCSRMQAR